MSGTIGVFIVDDSAVVRQVLTALLARDDEIRVLGAAPDPLFAIERMRHDWPDVVLLDIEMPRMDGITFLKKLMAERPTPVVICSTLTENGAATTMDALAAGAVGIVCKPKLGLKSFLEGSAADLIASVKAAARSNMRNVKRTSPVRSPGHASSINGSASFGPAHQLDETTEQVVAIGTSTGGTQALEHVLRALPRVIPGIVVVQHMPERFTALFAERLDKLCAMEVREARNGDRVLPGRALIAPGGRHMVLRRNGAYYHVEILDGPRVNRHKPSVDVLFRSVAKAAGASAAGVIMTGMGDDGAAGLSEMSAAGAFTLAQDEATCVVFGMPAAAIKRGGVDRVVPLGRIADEILQYAMRRAKG